MREFDLPCLDSRKSFYGKAKIIELDNGIKQLKSYNTIVGEIDTTNNYIELWDGKTQTTTRHIKSFKKYYNLEA
jgi:hypothetical protein